jgi:diguanylate cyclase (GGDEF)-like protein
LQVCALVRQQAREPYTYILLLTSKSDKADMVEGMEAGADDYISKPFEQNELKARLRAGRRIVELQAELLAAREALREQATRDALTKVWNRRSILEILEKELARSQRDEQPLSLVLFDLDHFKAINDTHGHLSGDGVLREVAARVQTSLRSYDSFGRYGGEEFLIVLPGCDTQQALVLAERTRELIGSQPANCCEEEIPVTASFGVATLAPGVSDGNGLIRIADKALYKAKAQGRNRVVFLAGDAKLQPQD